MNNQIPVSKKIHRFIRLSNFTLALFTIIEFLKIILEMGYQFHFADSSLWLIHLIDFFLLMSYLVNLIVHWFYVKAGHKHFGIGALDIIAILAILFFSINSGIMVIVILLRQTTVFFRFIYQKPLVQNFLSWLLTNPAKLTIFSFVIIIVIGTVLLTFPVATKDKTGADFLTALFTATSATCVTGLVVVDTGSYFSLFGQIVIICLIQIGALGIMTFSSSLALAFGRRFGIRERATLQDIFDVPDAVMLKRIILYFVKMTFWVELVGAFFLFYRFSSEYESFYRCIYSAVFHSVAAFCNAGFSLFPDNLVKFQGDCIVNFTICGLIIIGGIGFAVVANIFDRKNYFRGRKGFFKNLTVHTKIVLIMTFILIVLGTILIFFFEYDNALMTMPFGTKILAAFFQSVTLRTAGFNTIDLTNLKNITIFIMIIWMFIGVAPGSTGGGIKVTTFGILILTIKTLLSGRRDVEVFRRTISQFTVYKSVAIFMVALSILGFLFGLLLTSENNNFAALLFESTSAFGTVGLSLGITSSLTSIGRIIIILLMFVGRIGPLTLAYAIGEKMVQANVNYPDARVMVG